MYTQKLLNNANNILHFSFQMLANPTVCSEPYDLPEGKRKYKTTPCDSGWGGALSMGGEEIVNLPIFLFNANHP